MRRLVALVVVLSLLAGALAIVDVVVRKGVEAAMAARIESHSPGSHAAVTISSFPFLGRLAVSGTVPSLHAEVTGVKDGSVRFSRIDLRVVDLKVDRSKLLHGEVRALSIKSGRVVADVSQASIDALSPVALTLGRGTIRVANVTVAVHVTVTKGAILIDAGHGLPSLHVSVPVLDILPCVGSGRIVPGALQLSCRFTKLPGLLTGTTFHT